MKATISGSNTRAPSQLSDSETAPTTTTSGPSLFSKAADVFNRTFGVSSGVMGTAEQQFTRTTYETPAPRK